MIKIGKITQEQLNRLQKSRNPKTIFKELVGLNKTAKYEIGDTCIDADRVKPMDIIKKSFNGRDFYYIIVKQFNEDLVFAYSLYPVG